VLVENDTATRRLLLDKATRLRIHSIRATTEAGSGHPTSCASAADIVATLFFAIFRRGADGSYRDRFILSKGHAAPLLYAAWVEAGAVPEDRLLTLRNFDSDFEGHPTPRLPSVDVATGSLGQGLSAGVGLALDAHCLREKDQRIYVLMGDGENAEGSVWEAAAAAAHYKLENLCVTVDVNRLGQSEPTMLGYCMDVYEARWRAFGWEVFTVDGHDFSELLTAYQRASETRQRPSVVLARTRKGEGIPNIADKSGYHGKPLTKEEAAAAIAHLGKQLQTPAPEFPRVSLPKRAETPPAPPLAAAKPPYSQGGKAVASRKAFGEALAALGSLHPHVVVLDADVKNSTYTELFQEAAPERFYQMYISEQNMAGVAMGLASAGRVPFAATFACFFTRAADFIRMAAISGSNIKLVGTHAGVSIGEDGPSQMGLEDLAMCCAEPNYTVLYPSDAVSTWRATMLMAGHNGPCYLRASRPATPILYGAEEPFAIGKSKVVRRSDGDRATIIGGGVTLFEALKAYDELKGEGISVRVIDLFSVQPLDVETIVSSLQETGGRLVTVEDHYRRGGLGEAVCAIAAGAGVGLRAKILAVGEIPRSGAPKELLDAYGISARHIVQAVKQVLK
jgi:transketolase